MPSVPSSRSSSGTKHHAFAGDAGALASNSTSGSDPILNRQTFSPVSSTAVLPALALLQHQRVTAEMLEGSQNSTDGRRRRAIVTASVVVLVLMGALVMDTVTEARRTADEAAPHLDLQVCAQLRRISGGGGDLPQECAEKLGTLTEDELAEIAGEETAPEEARRRFPEPISWFISKAMRDPILRALKRKISSEVAEEDEQLRKELGERVAAAQAEAAAAAEAAGALKRAQAEARRTAGKGAGGEQGEGKGRGKVGDGGKGGQGGAKQKGEGPGMGGHRKGGDSKGGKGGGVKEKPPSSDKQRPLTIRRRRLLSSGGQWSGGGGGGGAAAAEDAEEHGGGGA